MQEPTRGAQSEGRQPEISVARVYDYLLGGTNNGESDRRAAGQLAALFPELKDWAWCNRAFHQRAARWLATEAGIAQFIDLGSGLPTQNNTHEVVQPINPKARVVYVDNDPMVVEHAPALLSEDGNTTFLSADIRDPDSILSHPELLDLVDLEQPVGLLMTAVVHFVADSYDPHALVRRYLDAVPSDSYLVLSHGTYDRQPEDVIRRAQAVYQNASEQMHMRPKHEVERFFDGLELVPPYEGSGPVVTYGGLWGAEDPEAADDDSTRVFYAGVARKP
ncbi:MAG TPA: SAM-dependent methyltransferase [Actinopolymorphaceae bacterium]